MIDEELSVLPVGNPNRGRNRVVGGIRDRATADRNGPENAPETGRSEGTVPKCPLKEQMSISSVSLVAHTQFSTPIHRYSRRFLDLVPAESNCLYDMQFERKKQRQTARRHRSNADGRVRSRRRGDALIFRGCPSERFRGRYDCGSR